MNAIHDLQRTIGTRYGCHVFHSASVPVKETLEDGTIWEGTVEVFDLKGHRTAKRCYGWTKVDDSGETHYTAVLETFSVDTPEKAVHEAHK